MRWKADGFWSPEPSSDSARRDSGERGADERADGLVFGEESVVTIE